ncbi:hypothetical protein RHMOL_Rhmol11G0003600 [Rhododendron molle]|uniref:Uncharacterized protein n=1 Tax=Rhododendron molle TaxID=49168 RepID=A0ACC0LN97_RHOML|nr:hypothetical protein RHMOL_Rhmol11G0003600 [Rhododendron molle]
MNLQASITTIQQRAAQTDANITRLNDLFDTRLPLVVQEESEAEEDVHTQPIMVEDPNNPGRLIVQPNPRVVCAPAANPNLEDPQVLGDHISTFSSVFDSVCDANHDPCSYIVNEEFSRLEVPYPNNKDCSVMVKDLVPQANLWDVDEVVDIQVGAQVWAVNRSSTEGELWDVPFMANPEPITEVAVVTD